MIKTKKDLEFYLAADKFSLERKKKYPILNDEIWLYQILLRKAEYYKNQTPSFFNKIRLSFYQFRLHRLGIILGFDIPLNCFGPGLRINHYGNIIVNNGASIGMWCDIHQGVNIGSNNSPDGISLTPVIGTNVWIGPGAKLFGDITIGDGVSIGANSVVNKSAQNNTTIAGIPAKIIKHSGTESIDVAASKYRMENFFLVHPEYRSYLKM